MKQVHFTLFIIGLLFLFSTLFTRYYLTGKWSTGLTLLVVDSLLLTIVSFLSMKIKK